MSVFKTNSMQVAEKLAKEQYVFKLRGLNNV